MADLERHARACKKQEFLASSMAGVLRALRDMGEVPRCHHDDIDRLLAEFDAARAEEDAAINGEQASA